MKGRAVAAGALLIPALIIAKDLARATRESRVIRTVSEIPVKAIVHQGEGELRAPETIQAVQAYSDRDDKKK